MQSHWVGSQPQAERTRGRMLLSTLKESLSGGDVTCVICMWSTHSAAREIAHRTQARGAHICASGTAARFRSLNADSVVSTTARHKQLIKELVEQFENEELEKQQAALPDVKRARGVFCCHPYQCHLLPSCINSLRASY